MSADTTQDSETRVIDIDGQPVPLDDCIWLERRPCGCIVSAVVAVVPRAWTLATAEEATQHFHSDESERRQARAAGLTTFPVTGRQYREQYRPSWRCDAHARPSA